ncbi:MAG: hypothetical protein KatS3mg087_1390 [Patescibacteria group bacterium]|nr:MAG: hypothetical protein KatS3mg087_1390 [Patescibacteria group bacterium]
MQDTIKYLFSSKRFLMALATIITVAFKDSLPLNEEQLQQLLIVVASWIIGDSIRPTDPTRNLQPKRYLHS